MTNQQPPNVQNSRYEQNSSDQQALESAAAEVPLKSYDDYEIEVESVGNYDDAIFQNEAMMLASLTPEQVRPPAKPKPAQEEPKPVTTVEVATVSFERFLCNTSALKTVPSLIKSGINNSPPHPVGEIEQLIIDKAPEIKHKDERSKQLEQHTETTQQSSLFKRVQTIVKNQLTHGQNILDAQLGRNLPERLIPLTFQLPTQKPQVLPSFEEIKPLLNASKIKPAALAHLEQVLEIIVRSNVSNNQRSRWLELALPILAQRSHAMVQVLSRKPQLANDTERQASFYSCLKGLKHCSNLLRQLYSNIYQGPNVLYAQQQNDANGYLQQLFDCLCLEQRLAFAGHGEVSEQQIKTLNTLYTVAAHYEWHVLDQAFDSFALQTSTTVRALFIRYQLLHKLPQQKFCASLQPTLLAYLEQHFHYFNVLPLGYSESLQHACLCTTASNRQAAKNNFVVGRENANDQSTIVIQWQGFINQVRNDYLASLNQLHNNSSTADISPALIKVPHRTRLVFISLLHQAITDMCSNRAVASFSIYQSAVFQSLSGISSLLKQHQFEFITTANTNVKGKTANPEQAERPRLGAKNWGIAHRDESQWFVSVDERNSNLALEIGELLILTEQRDEKIERTVTLIDSIERPADELTKLELRVLGHDSCAIKIESKDTAIDGLIVSEGELRYLLLAQAPFLKTGTKLTAIFANGLTATAVIAGLTEVTTKVYRYQLAALV